MTKIDGRFDEILIQGGTNYDAELMETSKRNFVSRYVHGIYNISQVVRPRKFIQLIFPFSNNDAKLMRNLEKSFSSRYVGEYATLRGFLSPGKVCATYLCIPAFTIPTK